MDNYPEFIPGIFNRISPLSEGSLAKIIQILEVATHEKMDHIVRYQKRNDKEYVLLSGICRSYITDYEDKEATLSFYEPGQVFPPNQIRTSDQLALYNIQALTPVLIVKFNRYEFTQLMRENPDIDRWGWSVYEYELK